MNRIVNLNYSFICTVFVFFGGCFFVCFNEDYNGIIRGVFYSKDFLVLLMG